MVSENIEFTASTGNVFADLEAGDPEELLARGELSMSRCLHLDAIAPEVAWMMERS